MDGVLLIVVLTITGGAIAFIGDRLGSKIGKKRLSIFGLRPRHTSIVITIFTGVCITTLTFGVMAAVSENVRTALFGMERLNRSMIETQQSLSRVQDDLFAAQQEQASTNDALIRAKEDVANLKTQQAELEEESSRLQEGNRLLEEAKIELMRRNDELGSKNSELTNQNEKLTTDNNMLAKLTDKLRSDFITMREGNIVFQAGEVIASGVIRGNRPVSEVETDMQALAQLANRNVSAKLGKDISDEDIWMFRPEYDATVKRISESPQDMVVRIVASGNLLRGESVYTSLECYKNSVIYKDKEFIIAKPVQILNGSDAEAEKEVMSFLREVNLAATSRGILPDPIHGSVGIMEGEQFYDIVSSLRGKYGSFVLSAYANGNTDALGPLRLTLKLEDKLSDSIIR